MSFGYIYIYIYTAELR